MNDDFKKIYLDILNNQSIDSDNWLNNNDLTYESIYLNTYRILNEYVENPQLTPIPKNVFIDIIKRLKTKINNKYTITYKEIHDLLYRYDYQYYDDFKQNLLKYNKFNGKLTIAILNNDPNIIHEFLDEEFDFIKINDLINQLNNDPTGIIDSWNKDLSSPKILDKNVVILINRDLIQLDQSWKDTLEHELTHFIQRIVGFNKTLQKRIQYNGPNSVNQYNNNVKQLIDIILSKTTLNKNNVIAGFNRFINYILKPNEIEPSSKSCINRFQRMYETSKITFNNNKFKLNIKKLEDRLIWLNEFLNKINNLQYYNSEEFINLFDTYFLKNKNNLTYYQFLQYNQLFAILIYIIYKLNNINIEQDIKEHFKTFILRDC